MAGPIVARSWWPLAVALLVAIALALAATTPPAPKPSEAPAADFAAGRAMADVDVIAAGPHTTGTAENAAVRSYLLARMRALGLETGTQVGPLEGRGLARRNQWSGRADAAVPMVNLIGILPGRDRSLPAVMLMAHHDSVWGSPAAADDGAGVATILEVVRAVREGGQPQRDLIVLLTDAEELGLSGARLFWTRHPLRARVGAVINMEARGGGGRTTMFQTSKANGAAARLYAAAVNRPGTSSLATFVYSVLPNDTDLSEVLKASSATGYNFAFIGRPGLYHSPMATPARLDRGALQDMGGQVLDLTRALLAAPRLPGRSPDSVFFDLFGRMTVLYPPWVGWLILGAAGLGLAAALCREGPTGVAGGAARMAMLLVGSAVLLFALNRLSIGPGPVNYYDRLAAIPRLEVMALCAALAAFLLILGHRAATRAEQVGAALPLLLIAIAVQIAAPTAAYVLAIPLLFSAAALQRDWPILRAAFAAPILGYMLALGHQLMQGVGPDLPSVAALPLALGALAVLPLWPGLARARLAGVVLLVAALALALWVRWDAPAETRAVYSDHQK